MEKISFILGRSPTLDFRIYKLSPVSKIMSVFLSPRKVIHLNRIHNTCSYDYFLYFYSFETGQYNFRDYDKNSVDAVSIDFIESVERALGFKMEFSAFTKSMAVAK